MRFVLTLTLFFVLPLIGTSQGAHTLSRVCMQVSEQWRLDSNACKGYRLKVAQLLKKAKADSISKAFLFSALGKPNKIQKYYVGYPERKNYVEYIYNIYKDDCPKIKVEGASLGFVFDEFETFFIKIQNHDYCG